MERSTLEPLLRPFSGEVFCHAPADRAFVLGALARADDGHDRWSTGGTRTAYLAGDAWTAIAEFARHGQSDGPPDDRRLVRLRLAAVTTIDLRGATTRAALGITDGPGAFLDRRCARELSAEIRSAGACEGLIVPSMAFLDRPERFNVVLFCEAIGPGLETVLRDPGRRAESR